MSRLLAALLACLYAAPAMAQPRDVDPWEPPPVAVGGSLFLAGYASAVVWATQTEADDNALFVPLFGPWLELFGLPDCSPGELFCDHADGKIAFHIADGLVQTAGFVLLVARLTDRDDDEILIAPARPAGAPGMVVSGRF